MNTAKQYWNNLQPRERLVLGAGGAALLLILLYAAVWDPYQAHVARLEQTISRQKADLEWMRGAAAQIGALRKGTPKRAATGQSLLSLADSTARAQGLADAVKRVQPEGQNGVRVWLEQAAFDDAMRWLQALTTVHGVKVSAVVVEPAEGAGRTNIRLLLEGAS